MANRQRRSLRLRTRVTLFFSLTALVAGLALAVVTYAVARNFLVDQRSETILTQAVANATSVRSTLLQIPPVPDSQVDSLVKSLKRSSEGFAFLRVSGKEDPSVSDAAFPTTAYPAELMTYVAQGGSATQRFSVKGEPFLAVGIYIPAAHAQYFEAIPLRDTDRALRAIGTALGIGAAVTTIFAGALGWSTSRRLLRPISRVATTAGEIASGGFDARMAPESDPDLARLAKSFNDMADAVQTRFEREARFASDVSHELRSPITALTAAVEVLDSRRTDLPDRTQQALDVVVGQVRRFDQMVMDLLELSRIDAGSTELIREEVDVEELVTRIAQRYGFGDTPIEIDPKVSKTLRVDKLRFERILANLLENAREHAGGPSRVKVEPHGRHGIALSVDDVGPGVARGERVRIFERFARGSAARHRVGTGLGLALVAEHAHAHGGEAWVEDRPGGGARFKVSFAGGGLMLKRLVTIAVALAAVLVGCGIPDHGQVSTIQNKDLRQLGDTIPPTSTSTIPPTTLDPTTTTTAIDTATTIAIEDVTVYFISGGQLKGYPRSLARPATTNAVLSALQEGQPPGDAGVGIRSAVPTKEQSLLGVTDDGSGVATIHLPQGFFEQIPPEDQLLAIGQLVLTITEIRGIGQVLFVQDGLPRGVPRGSGGITDGTEPLARRDYQDLLNPASTTTTTTTTQPVLPVDTTVA